MKNIFIIILSLFLGLEILAQSFPLTSSKWYYANNGGIQPPNSTLIIYEYVRDTIIHDTTGRMVTNGLVFYSHHDSVFFYNTKQNRFGLLYVFSASVGDTLTLSIPPDWPTEELFFKVVIESIKKEIYEQDTLLKFTTYPLHPDYHFDENIYWTRIGAYKFLPSWGVSLPEGDYLKCYTDSSLYLNFSGIPCDSIVTGFDPEYFTGELRIFPNPAEDEVTIQTNRNESFRIRIISFAGEQVLNDPANYRNYGLINISAFPPGYYLIEIIFESGEVVTKRFFIK